MLYEIKVLLGIDSEDKTKDAVLTFLMESMNEKAKRYCRLKEIPAEMENLLIEIIVSRFRTQNYGSSDIPTTVTNISDNGQSVGFKLVGGTDEIKASGFTESEEAMLNLWRRLW